MAYPTSFALIRNGAGEVTGYFVTDAEHCGTYLATGLWRSDDGGANWRLVQQYTFCQTVAIDPFDPRRVYLSGDWPGWGQGGAMFSVDGGETFQVNDAFPDPVFDLVRHAGPERSAHRLFYSCFGGGHPARAQACGGVSGGRLCRVMARLVRATYSRTSRKNWPGQAGP